MPSTFNVELLKNKLHTSWLGSEFLYIDRVESTSSYLKKVPSSELVHGTVLITDNQTKGRGQYNRKWSAEPGKNLTFTIAFRPAAADRLTLLTLTCANAVTTVLQDLLEQSVRIKWPNDIFIHGKKVGGVLTECCFNGKKLDRVLIGIGLNVDQTFTDSELKMKAASITSFTNKAISREELLSKLLEAIELGYKNWHKFDNELQKAISQKMIGYGEWVSLQINNKIESQKYKFLGVNQKGELTALNEQLDVKTFSYEQIRIIPDRTKVSETEYQKSAGK